MTPLQSFKKKAKRKLQKLKAFKKRPIKRKIKKQKPGSMYQKVKETKTKLRKAIKTLGR